MSETLEAVHEPVDANATGHLLLYSEANDERATHFTSTRISPNAYLRGLSAVRREENAYVLIHAEAVQDLERAEKRAIALLLKKTEVESIVVQNLPRPTAIAILRQVARELRGLDQKTKA